MITCSSCKSENFFIDFSGIIQEEEIVNRVPMKATCRSCGGHTFDNFFLSAMPKQDFLKAELERLTVPDQLENLKDDFFWFDDKHLQQKYCILFNIYQHLRFRKVQIAPDEDLQTMVIEASGLLQHEGHTFTLAQEESTFTGPVFFLADGLVGKAVLSDCRKVVGNGIKAYENRFALPLEDRFMNTNEAGFKRLMNYACIFTEITMFEQPVPYSYGAGFLRGNINL